MADLFSFLDTAPPPPTPRSAPPRLRAAAAPSRAITPPPADAHSNLPAVPIAWERLLARAPDVPIVICVSTLWTGIVREVLCFPGVGRQALYKEGTIGELAGVSVPSRDIYLTVDQTRGLSRHHGLILLGRPGRTNARFRFIPNAGNTEDVVSETLDALLGAATA
jgi:hypothetical protein